ncbi:hypothetical protein COY07_01390 [Candidatus Peregrinibacteria bacterium CG_4_10_14_0_2_um_filter_43_11]|nr:MAG: hypothetical protein COY07_01390 [Candidatus Peregrinibacteria bacterium CG_4_10_14_0_2_um_filter_43_11]
MIIQYSKRFLSDVSGLNLQQKKRLAQRISLFLKEPNHSTLRNHGLKGKLKGFYSFNITGDIAGIV